MSDLRRFEVTASLVLLAFLSVVGGALLLLGHPRAIAGLVAGGLLGTMDHRLGGVLGDDLQRVRTERRRWLLAP